MRKSMEKERRSNQSSLSAIFSPNTLDEVLARPQSGDKVLRWKTLQAAPLLVMKYYTFTFLDNRGKYFRRSH